MRTGRAGPRWGARSLGRGAGKFTARVCKPGLGVGGQPGVPCVQPSRLESPRPPPRASPPAWRGAPERRAPRLSPAELPGLALHVLESLTCEHGGPRPRPAGNFPDLLVSIAAVAAAGWLCVCARVRVCVRLCVRPAGGRAGSAKRLLLSPAGDASAAGSCGRLTGGCVAPPLAEPPSLFACPQPPRETTARAAGARGSRSGSGAGAPRLGPALGCSAVVLNGQLRAPQLRARPPPQTPEMQLPPPQLLDSPRRVTATPVHSRLDTGPAPFPSLGDSCYCHAPSSQGAGRGLPTVTFPHWVRGESPAGEGGAACVSLGEGQSSRNPGFPLLGT